MLLLNISCVITELMRSSSSGIADWSEEVVNLAYEFRNDGVVGIDIAGGSNQPEDTELVLPAHIAAFQRAEQLGLHITAHAGEAGSARRVKEAIDELRAERIGHGYRVLQDDSIYQEVRTKGVHLETCPISSICTGAVPEDIHQHPIVRFAHDGVNFSLNSDDPLVFDSCPLDDYLAGKEAGLTEEHIIQAIFNAAQSSFASKEEKQTILDELVKTYGDKYLASRDK